MIVYEHGFLGLGTLTRIYGSAAYQVILPAIISTCFLIGYHQYRIYSNSIDNSNYNNDNRIIVVQNPYAIGALISFFSFLLTFRLNYSYMRYWEGATAVHNMLSEWLDCGSMIAAFHYQSEQYKDIEPPTFAELAFTQFPHTYGIISLDEYYFKGREREYRGPQSYDEAIQQILQNQQQHNNSSNNTQGIQLSLQNDEVKQKRREQPLPESEKEVIKDTMIQEKSNDTATTHEKNIDSAVVSTIRTKHSSSFSRFRRSDTTESYQSTSSKHSTDKPKSTSGSVDNTTSTTTVTGTGGGIVGIVSSEKKVVSEKKQHKHHRITTMEIADFQQLEVSASSKRISNFATSITASSLGNKGLRTVSSLHSILSSDDENNDYNEYESSNFFLDISKRDIIDDETIIPIQQRIQSAIRHQQDANDDDDDNDNNDWIQKMRTELQSKRSNHTTTTDTCVGTFSSKASDSIVPIGDTAPTIYESQNVVEQEEEINLQQQVRQESDEQKQEKSKLHAEQVSTLPRLTIARRRKFARQMTPSLFLQEVTHLLSLLSAVAMCTLRNDIECASLPLEEYRTTSPIPSKPLDDNEKNQQQEKKKKTTKKQQSTWRIVSSYLFGTTRSSKQRTLYNAEHPLGVLGGISDNEIKFLERARGPYAKVTMVTMWLEEFISREYCNGSMGTVASPIITRLYSILSDGTVAYNQARKIAYVPFPFPNAQIASFFSMAIIFIFPLLYDEYVNKYWFAAILNFVTVLCFLGLHEVARELENPFINVPNDLPLVTFQDEFNDALLTTYAGFHPDSYWELKPIVVPNNNNNNNNKGVSDLVSSNPPPMMEDDDACNMRPPETGETIEDCDYMQHLLNHRQQQHDQNHDIHEKSVVHEQLTDNMIPCTGNDGKNRLEETTFENNNDIYDAYEIEEPLQKHDENFTVHNEIVDGVHLNGNVTSFSSCDGKSRSIETTLENNSNEYDYNQPLMNEDEQQQQQQQKYDEIHIVDVACTLHSTKSECSI